MKKLFSIRLLSILVCLFCLTACEKDLEPTFYNRLGLNEFPKTPEEVKAAVTGIYGTTLSDFASIGWQHSFIMEEAMTDEFISAKPNSTWLTYSNLTWISSEPHVTVMYPIFVKGITKSINTIAAIDQAKLNEDLKTQYKAELHGIIALLAYRLYNFYGPTAIVTDPNITLDPNADFKPERPTKEWMIDFIKGEARKSADSLPVSYSSSNDYGRITKGTALMILLKLAMHEKSWEEAVTISDEIINLGYYQLQNSYYSIFTVDNEMNKEIILAIPRSVASGPNTWMASILRDYLPTSGNLNIVTGGYYRVPWDMYDKYEPGDDRLKNIWNTSNTVNGIIDLRTSTDIYHYTGAVPYKYPLDPDRDGNNNGNDIVIYRYADVLLLKAEALNNIQGPNQESIDLINMIRGRAKTTLVDLSQFSDKQALNDFILDERFRELFFEGCRRQDLIRNGKFLSEAAKRGATITLDDHLLVFPIPQSDIDANSKIVQNAGY